MIGSGPKAGEEFAVTVPSHVSASARFESGQSATLIFSFDSPRRRTLLEVTGTEATMVFPDPNMFEGEIAVQTRGRRGCGSRRDHHAALGSGGRACSTWPARSARAGRTGPKGALAYHVLDAMISIDEAITSQAYVDVESTVERPALLPADWDPHGRHPLTLLAHACRKPPDRRRRGGNGTALLDKSQHGGRGVSISSGQ